MAQEPENEELEASSITKFQQLADQQLVHRNVIDSITNMGITDMTDVQVATINQALRGTDM